MPQSQVQPTNKHLAIVSALSVPHYHYVATYDWRQGVANNSEIVTVDILPAYLLRGIRGLAHAIPFLVILIYCTYLLPPMESIVLVAHPKAGMPRTHVSTWLSKQILLQTFELHTLQLTRPSCPSSCGRCMFSYFSLRNIEEMGEVAGQGKTSGDGL